MPESGIYFVKLGLGQYVTNLIGIFLSILVYFLRKRETLEVTKMRKNKKRRKRGKRKRRGKGERKEEVKEKEKREFLF